MNTENLINRNSEATNIIDGKTDDSNGNIVSENKLLNICIKFHMFVINFTKASSIHGFVYLMNRGLHAIERLLWASCICIAIFGTVSLAQRTWNRFQTSPMVISMDRNKFSWNTSFPSLTVCPHTRIDDAKVEEYFFEHPEKFTNQQDKIDFTYFIKKLANISYINFDELPPLNDSFNIQSEEYLDLLFNLSWTFKPEITSGATIKFHLQETITELGICYSINSNIAVYNSYSYWKENRWDLLAPNETATVHILDGEIYSQIINLSSSYEVYFHGAMDVPDISKQRYTFSANDYTTVELLALEIITSENAKDLSVSQRKCRFIHESDVMKTSPVYSFNLCQSECRMHLSLKMCNCSPHFYRNKGKYGEKFPICDVKGLHCLVKIKHELITLRSNLTKNNCKCLSNCDDSNFFVQAYRSRFWFLGANLQWGISDYPKMQLNRDLIFGFTDLLVYIGGTAGFFLGCSLLSLAEFVYFFSWRLVKHFYNCKTNYFCFSNFKIK